MLPPPLEALVDELDDDELDDEEDEPVVGPAEELAPPAPDSVGVNINTSL